MSRVGVSQLLPLKNINSVAKWSPEPVGDRERQHHQRKSKKSRVQTIRALSRSVPFWNDVPVVLLNQSIIIGARLLADLSTANIALGFMLSKKRFCRRSDDEGLLAAQAKFIPPILRH